jgi:hypothetical protein
VLLVYPLQLLIHGLIFVFHRFSLIPSPRHKREWPARDTIRFMPLCTPGTGVNLWGESPLYVNPVSDVYH